MAIDFTFPPEVEDARQRMRAFVDEDVRPTEERLSSDRAGRGDWRAELDRLRSKARELDLWMPHMPRPWGGAGFGPTALAAVSAEAAKTRWGAYIVNCYAPDEGNMHTLLHFGTDEQKDRYLKPMCEGTMRSCFAMTEPEVAGSDPTLMQTRAELDGDEWVINGHKWFISGARGAQFAILLARTEDDPEVPQAATSAFIVDVPSPRLGACTGRGDDVGEPQPLRDPDHRPSCPAVPRARRAWPRPPARSEAARTRPPGPLHALAGPDRNGARHDGGAGRSSDTRTVRICRRSRASSGSSASRPSSCTRPSSWCSTPPI